MLAMVCDDPGSGHVVGRDRPVPRPAAGQVRLRVEACGVCRTDLHVVDGELPGVAAGRVPGHEVVGVVEELGSGVGVLAVGQRVGVPWLAWTCGECDRCREGAENLCPKARFTGYTVDGGFAEQMVAEAEYCLPLPERYGDAPATPLDLAPLLCAGLIGHRAYRMAGGGRRLGIYGFGAAGHLLAQIARHEGREVYAFTRPGDDRTQAFARSLGATWAGGADEAPPAELDAAILFAPAGELLPAALGRVRPGGTVVCGGIHMSDIPSFPYRLLWEERQVRSVANLTRADGRDYLAIAPSVPVRTTVTRYDLADADRALDDLRHGRFEGAAVLVPR